MPFYGFHDQIRFFNTTKEREQDKYCIGLPKTPIALVVSLDSYLIGISSSKVIRLLLQYMLNKVCLLEIIHQ
jgi:hypothetical protein